MSDPLLRAIELTDAHIKSNPCDEDAWIEKGVMLSRVKRYDEAIECWDQCICLNRTNRIAWEWKGSTLEEYSNVDILAKRQRQEEAIEAFDEFFRLTEIEKRELKTKQVVDPDVIDALVDDQLCVSRRKGHILYCNNQYEDAIATWDLCLELVREKLETEKDVHYLGTVQFSILENKTWAFIKLRRYKEAVQCAESWRAITSRRLREYDGVSFHTMEEFLENASLTEEQESWLRAVGVLLYKLGHYKRAYKYWNECNPRNVKNQKVQEWKRICLEKIAKNE